MSKKTSTAALDSFREGQLTIRRRAPRHPSGAKRSNKAKTRRNNEVPREFGQAQIAVREEGVVNGKRASGTPRKIHVILPVILRIAFSLVLWTLGAATMTLVEEQSPEHPATHKLPSI